jgi:hypothetical protein
MNPNLGIICSNLSFTFISSYCISSIFRKYIRPSAQYYLLHSIFNLYIMSVTYTDAIEFYMNPILDTSFYAESAISSSSAIIGFHLYHYISEALDLETKIHHIITVFISGGITLFYPAGIGVAAINCIMCGLPGGIDYILLVLYKYELIDKLTEKYWNRWLNLLIRMPGMLLATWYYILHLINDSLDIYDHLGIIIGSLVMSINAIYYCNKTVGNYHIHYYRSQIAQQ